MYLRLFLYYLSPCIFSCLFFYYPVQCFVDFNKSPFQKKYIFASSNISNMCEKSVLDPIPHTQHRPICVSVNPVIVAQPTTFRRRLNLKKADWEGFLTSTLTTCFFTTEHVDSYTRMIYVSQLSNPLS